MKAEREIPIEDEPDEPFPSEYEPNELHNIMMKKAAGLPLAVIQGWGEKGA